MDRSGGVHDRTAVGRRAHGACADRMVIGPRFPADPLQGVDGEGLEFGAHVGSGPDDPVGEVGSLLALAGRQQRLAPPQVVADEP